MTNEILIIVLTSGLTGIVSTLATVKALNVHISYLKESISHLRGQIGDNRDAIARAHERLDQLKIVAEKYKL